MNKILVLDIETTGFLGQGGSIVEIGIVELDIDTGKIKGVFNSLLKEKILTAKHREKPFGWVFSNSDMKFEDVMNAPAAEEVFKEVQKVLDEYTLGCTAFNKKFDFSFLRSRGLKIKELPCPMILATDICKLEKPSGRKGYKWPKVEEAFNHFFSEIEYTEKHRGLDDAKHEAMVVYELYKLGIFTVEGIDKVFKPGDKVTYVTPCKKERGIVKGLNSDKTRAFVVYHCADQWEKYMNYTGASTRIEDLKDGWIDK